MKNSKSLKRIVIKKRLFPRFIEKVTYSSCVGGHGSDNKHEVEADYKLQSKSLAIL